MEEPNKTTELSAMLSKRAWQVMILLLLASISCFSSEAGQRVDADALRADMTREFADITPPESDTQTEYNVSLSLPFEREALVSALHDSPLSFDELLAYYDEELTSNGWVQIGIYEMRDWGRDLGGQKAVYCKGPYEATIQYAGELAEYGWDYAFSISWGTLSDCE